MVFNKRGLFTHKLVFQMRYSLVAEIYCYELTALYTLFALNEFMHYTHKSLAVCNDLRE